MGHTHAASTDFVHRVVFVTVNETNSLSLMFRRKHQRKETDSLMAAAISYLRKHQLLLFWSFTA